MADETETSKNIELISVKEKNKEAFDKLAVSMAQSAILQEEYAPFRENIIRILGLMNAYNTLEKSFGSLADDILRSNVTLMHATLEDTVRTTALNYMPLIGNEADFNLVLRMGRTRPQFSLVDFLDKRQLKVSDFIRDELAAFLATVSINHIGDLKNITHFLMPNHDDFENQLSLIALMIKRRHQIVHRADRLPDRTLENINRKQIYEWSTAVMDFLYGLKIKLMLALDSRPDIVNESCHFVRMHAILRDHEAT